MPPTDPSDRRAWLDWARQFQPALENEAWRILRHRHDAEEVVQEVLVQVWLDGKLRTRLARTPSPRAYLVRTAHNAAVDLVRARSRQPQATAALDQQAQPGQPYLPPQRALDQQLLNAAYDQLEKRLTDQQRRLFTALRSNPALRNADLIAILKRTASDIARKRKCIRNVARRALKEFKPP